MTCDERQDISEYLDIIKKNCERLLRSIEMMQDSIIRTKCSTDSDHEYEKSNKERFLEKY